MRNETRVVPPFTAALLAYTSGFVDTLSFVALFGLFAAHVTGNFVLLAASLSEFHHGVWIKLLAIPVFIIAAAGTRFYIVHRERHRLDAAARVLVAQALLLALLMAVASASAPITDHNSPVALFTGLLAAAAMAIQNTAARTFLNDLPPTTVMTGNMVQIVVDVVDVLHGHGPIDTKRARLGKLVPMLLAFIVGTLSGATGYVTVGFPCLIVPIIAVGLLAALVRCPEPGHA